MTIDKMQEKLKELGLKKTYFPIWEQETSTIVIKTRKPPQIIDGELNFSEIVLMPKYNNIFVVWTAHTRKARAIASKYCLKSKKMDFEIEIQVPAQFADEILPKLGAKVKRAISAASRDRLMAHSFSFGPRRDGVTVSLDQCMDKDTLPTKKHL